MQKPYELQRTVCSCRFLNSCHGRWIFDALTNFNCHGVDYSISLNLFAQFEETERKRARSEYEKLLFRQEMEAEDLRISSESGLKELQQLQVRSRTAQAHDQITFTDFV